MTRLLFTEYKENTFVMNLNLCELSFTKKVHMVYTFNPSMEGQDRWNPEFQKPCLQKAKQNKQMNNEPPPTPQKTFCTNVPKAHFLSAPHL